MIETRSLAKLNLSDLKRVAGGYSSDSKYAVSYKETGSYISFNLRLATLREPYVKRFHYDDETLQEYNAVIDAGYSFGAYDGDLLVGLIIAEGHRWNRSLFVHEFHVTETHRKLKYRQTIDGMCGRESELQGFSGNRLRDAEHESHCYQCLS